MPWTQDGSGGLANANGVSAVIATRRTGRIASENLRQSRTSLYSMNSGYPAPPHFVKQLRLLLETERRPGRFGRPLERPPHTAAHEAARNWRRPAAPPEIHSPHPPGDGAQHPPAR